jgi:hypothetical protein
MGDGIADTGLGKEVNMILPDARYGYLLEIWEVPEINLRTFAEVLGRHIESLHKA